MSQCARGRRQWPVLRGPAWRQLLSAQGLWGRSAGFGEHWHGFFGWRRVECRCCHRAWCMFQRIWFSGLVWSDLNNGASSALLKPGFRAHTAEPKRAVVRRIRPHCPVARRPVRAASLGAAASVDDDRCCDHNSSPGDGSPARRTTRGFAPTPSHSRSHSHPSCPARHPSSLQAAADTNLPRSPPTCREPFPLCRRQHRHERPRAQECGGVHTTPALLPDDGHDQTESLTDSLCGLDHRASGGPRQIDLAPCIGFIACPGAHNFCYTWPPPSRQTRRAPRSS